ncbi:MAG: ShlB/FhaC/HecB family hemolysin secretion/activation protein [Alphaproteobacteria bacterium]
MQQQRQILQKQEERRREELERLRKAAPPKKDGAQKDEALAGKAKHCVPVRKIIFNGAELLDKPTKKALQKPFVGKCMNIIDIMSVVRVVTNWYVAQGYVTARAYPPEQDLSKGVLIIKVIEGRTEKVDIYANGKPRKGVDTAFPNLVGKRLYIRDVEQGLDQINRLPTHDAKIRIEPGKTEGYSRLRVNTTHLTLPYMMGTIDNYGLKSTGELQTGASAYFGDVLGLYDSWAISYKTSDPFYKGQKASQEITASLSLPYGYWTLLVSGSYFDYRSELKGQTNTFKTDGVSRYLTAEIDRVLHRDRDSKTRLSGFINFKDTENYVEDIRLQTGSRKLNVAGVRLSHSHRLLGGLLDASVSGHWGVPMFGSLTDEKSLPGSPIAEFKKVSGDLSFYRPLKVGPLNLAWRLKAAGQWSSNDLYSTEQISLGGLYTVRGYKDQSLSGDTGAYVRNELVWSLPYLLPKKTQPFFGRMDLFAAYDAGWLKPDKDGTFEEGSVTGLAAGARLSSGILFGEAAYEKPLHAPDFIKKDELFRFQAGMSVKW